MNGTNEIVERYDIYKTDETYRVDKIVNMSNKYKLVSLYRNPKL